MCWTTYKSNNCMNFVELWRSPQSESSVTRKLLLHEDSSCRTVVSPLPLSSSSFPHSLQSLCTAEETWTVPSSHHDCSHSLSSQPAKTHQLQFAKEGKDFKPTPLYCVYAWRFHFVPPWLFYWIFFSQQSLEARGSNRNKEEQRRKTIGGSIKR